MSGVRISVEGMDRLAARLGVLERDLTAKVRDALVESAEETRNRAVQGIAKPPKTGVIYTHRFPSVFKGGQRRAKDKRAKPHQASAAGEYPAADTGNLMRSIYTDAREIIEPQPVMTADIIADAEYAKPLEYKPPERGGRPFLRRALAEESTVTVVRIAGAILEAVRGSRPPPGSPPGGGGTPRSGAPSAPRGPRPRPSSPQQSDADIAASLNRAEANRLRGAAPPPALPPPTGGGE